MDTIYSLASGGLPSAVAVIRLSGPEAWAVGERICRRSLRPRVVEYASLRCPETGNLLDCAVVLPFRGPASFTGDDVIEFQVHGGKAVVAAIFRVLNHCGCRPAQAGEFSRRAFLNGKMSLNGAEAINELIHAETELQRLKSLEMGMGVPFPQFEDWRASMLSSMALVEASIDFTDQEGVDAEASSRLAGSLKSLIGEVGLFYTLCQQGARIRDGVEILVLGPPNVGKSTLVNWLVGRDVAIVSDIAGTTRDMIEANISLGDIAVTFVDSAGLRDSENLIEAVGVERSLSRSKGADLVLWTTECCNLLPPPVDLDPERVIWVGSKADLLAKGGLEVCSAELILVSWVAQTGLDVLNREIDRRLRSIAFQPESAVLRSGRQVGKIGRILDDLRCAASCNDLEITAEFLRRGIGILDELSGALVSESVLDEIFSSFCIGK